MSTLDTHHEALISMACTDGWTRGYAWRSELRRIATEFGYGEFAELQESFGSNLPRPDAWRIVTEGKIIVLDFLEEVNDAE